MKILAVTAHPDDFEIGMGGLAVRLTDAGHTIVSVVLAAGRESMEESVRIEESKKSHALIGIEPILTMFDINHVHVHEISRKTGDRFFRAQEPDAVFAMWGMDIHPDHRAAAILTIEPFLQKGVHTELFAMEVCSKSGVPQTLGFAPTHYADITGGPAKTKEKMLSCHKSQGFDSLRTAHYELERNRGNECGVERAEAFVRLTRRGILADWLQPFFIPSPFALPRLMGIDATV
ncbi:MAG: PIG-L family deacetylase [Parcubacteria group bacterium]|nr:PIG-L family deacetylase [Parcubacteria group bacterium]